MWRALGAPSRTPVLQAPPSGPCRLVTVPGGPELTEVLRLARGAPKIPAEESNVRGQQEMAGWQGGSWPGRGPWRPCPGLGFWLSSWPPGKCLALRERLGRLPPNTVLPPLPETCHLAASGSCSVLVGQPWGKSHQAGPGPSPGLQGRVWAWRPWPGQPCGSSSRSAWALQSAGTGCPRRCPVLLAVLNDLAAIAQHGGAGRTRGAPQTAPQTLGGSGNRAAQAEGVRPNAGRA